MEGARFLQQHLQIPDHEWDTLFVKPPRIEAIEATIHKGILCSKATNNISSFEKKPENKGIPDIANDETNIVI